MSALPSAVPSAVPGVLAPRVGFLAGAVDDYMIRLELPGGVVHDCTVAQRESLRAELVVALETAARTATRDRRCRR